MHIQDKMYDILVRIYMTVCIYGFDSLGREVATPQMMINYAHLLEQGNYWERAFKASRNSR